MLKTVSAFAAVLIATALVVPTVSQAEDTQSVRVSYADLNLATAHGQDRLGRRIGYAAKIVCSFGETSSQPQLASVAKDCREVAIANTEPAFAAAVQAARRGTVTVLDAASLIVTAQ